MIRSSVLSLGLLLPGLPAWGATSDGLVSHWPLDQDLGGFTPDAILENHFTINGFVEIQPGQVGDSFLFDGVSSYLGIYHTEETAGSGLPAYRYNGYSITMWVKGPPQTAKYLFAEGSTASNTPLLILQTGQAAASSDKFDIIIRYDAGGAEGTPVNHRVSTSVVFDDEWHHVAWVDNNGQAVLYVDGVADATDFNYTTSGTMTLNTTAIGTLIRAAVATGAIFQGQIDDVGVWERALTAEEVNDVMLNGVPAAPTDAPPTIVAGPASLTRKTGDWMLLSVDAAGTRPFTYQWHRDGEAIPGATGDTYRLPNLSEADSGATFTVEVSNAVGNATTEPITLTVLPDAAPDVRAGLINYWPLDEAEETDGIFTTPDPYSGNDMVLNGFFDLTELPPGQFGNSLFFDLVNTYTYRTNGAAIANSPEFSISFWVKAPYEGQQDRRVFSEGSSTSNTPLFTMGTDPAASPGSPRLQVFIRDDANAVNLTRASTRPVFDDVWHHVVWTDINGEARLYIDGELDETDFTYARGTLTLDRTALGAVLRAAVSHNFYGNIDEVALWNRALSWTEIQEIMTEGIPEALEAIAPAIVSQPLPLVSGIYEGDTVTFTVQTTGTQPLSYQWMRNGEPISGAENPSALTETLTLENVQPADSATFTVEITNVAGGVISEEAVLVVAPYTPATSGVVLNLDVGLTSAPNVQPGFDEFNLARNGTRINGVRVTLSGIEAALADRNRATGAMVANNPPVMTQAQLYNDFIFANSTVDGTGMRILIENLAPETPYELTLWSFDPQSTGERISNWTDATSGEPVEIVSGYLFNGSQLPTENGHNTITGLLTSSPEGTLLIEGVRAGGTSVAVFLNALRLEANPGTRPLEITQFTVGDGVLRLSIYVPAWGPILQIQQTTDVVNGPWLPVESESTEYEPDSIIVVEFPATGEQMFYRVALIH